MSALLFQTSLSESARAPLGQMLSIAPREVFSTANAHLGGFYATFGLQGTVRERDSLGLTCESDRAVVPVYLLTTLMPPSTILLEIVA